ncbi:hypothetical protein [Ectobacillus panaciterrae]|nr:hypothetical protein [Ectobacillus panaciterrae]
MKREEEQNEVEDLIKLVEVINAKGDEGEVKEILKDNGRKDISPKDHLS